MKLLTRHWQAYGVQVRVVAMNWEKRPLHFQDKLERLIDLIDLYSSERQVSLVGISAGGSAALHAFCLRPKSIHRVVTIGSQVNPPSRMNVLAFQESLDQLLNIPDPHRIMTIRAQFGDELVPDESAIVAGAQNITVPCFEHRLSIGMAMLAYAKTIISFLRGK